MVLLIEHIARINEEEPPVLLLFLLLPQKPHRMDPPLYPFLQATTEMFRPVGLRVLHPPSPPTHTSPASIAKSPAYWPFSRALVKIDELP